MNVTIVIFRNNEMSVSGDSSVVVSVCITRPVGSDKCIMNESFAVRMRFKIAFIHSCTTSWTSASSFDSCLPLLDKLI